MDQLDLFTHVAAVYADRGDAPLSNADLYAAVAARAGIATGDLDARAPVGRAGTPRSLLKRQIRWHQQTLKAMGVVEHVDGARGVWQLVERGRKGLHSALPGVRLVAFSTRLGVAILGDCVDIMSRLDQPIDLMVTSPPYPLQTPRAYGGPIEAEYVDFVCRAVEPIVRRLAPSGSICLNVSNDIFEPGRPSRSLYLERLTLAMHERFGLSLMDRLIWRNPSKPPGPVRWASIHRVQLNAEYEPILWFAADPLRVKANNRRVLEAHTERHLKLLSSGGEQRTATYGDGAYRLRPGSFGGPTAGKIPRNILTRGHRCAHTNAYRRAAMGLGLPVHGAMQPLSVPDFLIRLLTDAGDLVVDPFGGSVKTGFAAESLGRRWLVAEKVLDFLRAGAEPFRGCEGFEMLDHVEMWPRQAA